MLEILFNLSRLITLSVFSLFSIKFSINVKKTFKIVLTEFYSIQL